MGKININKINLNDKKDRAYYTTEDIVIPKGTLLENWSNEQKEDFNRFEMIIGFGKDAAIPFRIYASELEEIVKSKPDLFDSKEQSA